MSVIIQTLSLCTANSVFCSGQQKDNDADLGAPSTPRTPVKTAKEPKIDKDVAEAVSYAMPPECIAAALALTTWYPSVTSAIKPAFSQNAARTCASRAICSLIG
jgi:hypothetical protein